MRTRFAQTSLAAHVDSGMIGSPDSDYSPRGRRRTAGKQVRAPRRVMARKRLTLTGLFLRDALPAGLTLALSVSLNQRLLFRIGWHEELGEPPGLDAATFTGPGGPDMRFRNDTGRWLLMQAEVDRENQVLPVRLYGTRPEREIVQPPVELANRVPAPTAPRYLDDPRPAASPVPQTDTARGGFTAATERIVRRGDTIIYQNRCFSRYQPWPDIVVRGTGS